MSSNDSSLGRVTAVVLAGGASQRFPPDKLAQLVDDESLLDRALASLPEEFVVVVVGSARQ
jgi:molybdopterin-guanine dinucleotide biosynthesis protein A